MQMCMYSERGEPKCQRAEGKPQSLSCSKILAVHVTQNMAEWQLWRLVINLFNTTFGIHITDMHQMGELSSQ